MADCRLITPCVLNTIFLRFRVSGASCNKVCRNPFYGKLSCCEHTAILSVGWPEFWAWWNKILRHNRPSLASYGPDKHLPFCSWSVDADDLGFGRHMTAQTVINRLLVDGYRSWRHAWCPRLILAHRRPRREWDQRHRVWDFHWKYCILSDESRFSLCHRDQGRIQDLKLGVAQMGAGVDVKFKFISNTIKIIIIVYIYFQYDRFIWNTIFYHNIVYLKTLYKYCNKNRIWKTFSGGARPVRPPLNPPLVMVGLKCVGDKAQGWSMPALRQLMAIGARQSWSEEQSIMTEEQPGQTGWDNEQASLLPGSDGSHAAIDEGVFGRNFVSVRDNAPPHAANDTVAFLDKNKLEVMD